MTRLKEGQKLGFNRAILPVAGDVEASTVSLALERVAHLKHLADRLLPCQ
jgi:predicted ATP-dependent serine protease